MAKYNYPCDIRVNVRIAIRVRNILYDFDRKFSFLVPPFLGNNRDRKLLLPVFFKFLFNFFRGGRGTLLDTGHGKPTSLCRRALLCVGFVAFVLPDTQLSNSSGSFNNNLVDQKVTIPIPLYRMLLLSSIDFLCKVNFNFTEVYLSI